MPEVTVVLMAYGTPRSREEIEPYYTDIRRGRPPTPELLADLVRRYEAIGGISPLAALTEAQRSALATALEQREPGRFEVVLGLKHAHPMIEETGAQLVARGVNKVVGLVLAPHYSSYSIGQYQDRLKASVEGSGCDVRGIESWASNPAYVAFLAEEVRKGLEKLPAGSKVLFTAHSLPERIIAAGDPYPSELRKTATWVSAAGNLAPGSWDIAYQSAGRTPEPWLGPDILAAIDELAAQGVPGVLVCPCGFVADHLEVLYDLDIEAAQHAEKKGIAFARTGSMNDNPAVIASLAEQVVGALA
jgi:ferrochelatase